MRSALLLLLCASALTAQQPNHPLATMAINGSAGPPFPIANVIVSSGTVTTFDVTGGANVPFITLSTPALAIGSSGSPNGFPLLGGLIDLAAFWVPGNLQIIFDGVFASPGAFSTNGVGQFNLSVTAPSTLPPGLSRAFQSLVIDPSASSGARFTAASSIFTQIGVTTIPLNLPNDGCVALDTQAQYGFSLPFYGNTYTRCQICSNGFIEFANQQNTGFTPSYAQVHQQAPKICGFWSDLDPSVPTAGSVTATIDQTAPNSPVVTVTFTNIPDWPTGVTGGVPFHTFKMSIDAGTGDVTLGQLPNSQSNYDMVVGITPGNSLHPGGVSTIATDLSAGLGTGTFVGQPNGAIIEGFSGVTSTTGTFTNPFDLAGLAIQFLSAGPNNYVMVPFVPGC